MARGQTIEKFLLWGTSRDERKRFGQKKTKKKFEKIFEKFWRPRLRPGGPQIEKFLLWETHGKARKRFW